MSGRAGRRRAARRAARVAAAAAPAAFEVESDSGSEGEEGRGAAHAAAAQAAHAAAAGAPPAAGPSPTSEYFHASAACASLPPLSAAQLRRLQMEVEEVNAGIFPGTETFIVQANGVVGINPATSSLRTTSRNAQLQSARMREERR